MYAYGHRGKWALGRIGERGTLGALTRYHKYLVPIFPKFLKMDRGENGHWKEEGTLKGLKGYPKCSVPIHPKFLQMGRKENWAWGLREKRTLGGKGYRNIRALKVSLSPNVHLPWSPFAPVPISPVPNSRKYISSSNSHFPKYSFFPSANLPQVLIYASVPICPGAHMLWCPFSSNAHLPRVSIHSKIAFSSGCTSHSSGATFWFDPASICAGPICPGPICPGSICPGAHSSRNHLSETQSSRTHLSGTNSSCSSFVRDLFVRDPFAWDPFVWCPIVQDPFVPGSYE